MFFRNKLRRRPQVNTTPVQALESRALKSGTAGFLGATQLQPIFTPEPVVNTPTVRLSNGELRVTGTSGMDSVEVKVHDRMFLTPFLAFKDVVELKVNGSVSLYPNSIVTSLRISTLGGNDSVRVDSFSARALDNIRIDTGHGLSERVQISGLNARNLSITSGGQSRNEIGVYSSSIAGTLSIDTSSSQYWFAGRYLTLGGNTARDGIFLSGSTIRQQAIQTGAGNDVLTYSQTTALYGLVDLGDGDDRLDAQSSNLWEGTYLGGNGEDTFNSVQTWHACATLRFEW